MNRFLQGLTSGARAALARRSRMIGVVVGGTGLLAGLGAYAAFGYQAAARFEASHPGTPMAVVRLWQEYERWHPTRQLTRLATARQEAEHIGEVEQQARLAELERLAADAEAEPEAAWQRFRKFRDE